MRSAGNGMLGGTDGFQCGTEGFQPALRLRPALADSVRLEDLTIVGRTHRAPCCISKCERRILLWGECARIGVGLWQ